MDFKDFRDGLLSLSLVLSIFSFSFMIISIVLKPYIALEPKDLQFIIILCIINILFCLYYLMEALRLGKILKLEDKYIIKFGKRIGIITIFYIPHFFFYISLFFRDLNNLELLIMSLIFFMEAMLLCIVFKEAYDLVFLDKTTRKLEIQQNRKKYIEKEKPSLL